MEYLKRIADDILEKKLLSSSAVLIEGPKWCGKTSTGAQKAKSAIYIQNPDKRESYRKMADAQPSLLLQGETPRLIDEWQTIPVIWDAVRFAADKRQEMNQFIDSDTFNVPSRYLLETSMRCIPRNDGTGGYMRVSDCGFGSEVREVAGTLEELLDDRQRQALKALRDEGASIEAWNEYHTVTDGMLIINDSLQLKQEITD